MQYQIKKCLKNEKYKGNQMHYFRGLTITEIHVNNLSGKPIVIPKYSVLSNEYKIYEGYYHFKFCYIMAEDNSNNYLKDYTKLLYREYESSFVLSEQEVNNKIIITQADNYDINPYIGIEITKGIVSVYDSYHLFGRYQKKSEYCYTGCEKDYALLIDAPLKELFLYNRIVSNMFIEKVIPVLRDFSKAFKKSCNLEQSKACINSMHEYLITTLNTVKELSSKTEIEAIEIMKKQTETEKFLENMKYRNEIAKQLQNC